MTATLVAKDLAAGHGDRTLFAELDLVVAPGDVIGLVGVNGAGKSSLLRLLAGLDQPEEGELRLSPPTATVGHLPQEPDRRPGETVREFLARRTGVAEAQATMDTATQALVDGAPGADDAYSESLERWLALGGADLDERAEEIAADLGLTVGLDLPMTALSGGQAARAGLASLLLSRYDVFLLDEPTNDLDLDGLERLERYVSGLRAGTVVISHDREFLMRTVTKVLELDLAQQQINLYGGGYAAYLEERERARRHAREEFEEYSDKRSALEGRALMQRSWMDKGVRNARRKASDSDKMARKFRSESSEKQAAKARQTQRMIERLDVVDEPRKEWELRMEIASAPRSGSVVATLREAEVVLGDFAFGRPRSRSTGRTGSPSRAPTEPASQPSSRPCSAASRWTRGTRASAPAWSSARSTRLGSCSTARSRSWRPSARPSPRRNPPRSARCSPSSACAPTM